MIALIDNDIILKLGKWDLFSELIYLLGGDVGCIYRLKSCLYVLCDPKHPGKALKRCGDQATIDRITDFYNRTSPIPTPREPTWLERLNNIPEIDVGEVLIFAVGLEEDVSITYLGDKRSLVALGNTVTLANAVKILAGRTKCLEQVIAEIVASYGFEHVLLKIRSRPDADKAMNYIFGTRPHCRQPMEIWDGLLSYYNDLKEKTNGLLAPYPDMPISHEPQKAL